MKYMEKYDRTPCSASLSTVLPSNFREDTERGCSILLSSRLTDLYMIITRETFSPPAVEPAHPPMNMSRNNTVFDSCGQRSKSTEENPVVVIIDDTWNTASVTALPTEAEVFHMFAVIMPDETKTIPRNT